MDHGYFELNLRRNQFKRRGKIGLEPVLDIYKYISLSITITPVLFIGPSSK